MATELPRSRVPAHVTLALGALLGGCVMGPDFERPQAAPPASYPSLAAAPADLPSRPLAAPYDGAGWWSVFRDPVLDGLVDEARRQNLDLQAAALRIEEARAQLGAAAAQGRPSVSGMGLGGRQRASANGFTSALAGGGQPGGAGAVFLELFEPAKQRLILTEGEAFAWHASNVGDD